MTDCYVWLVEVVDGRKDDMTLCLRESEILAHEAEHGCKLYLMDVPGYAGNFLSLGKKEVTDGANS